MTTLISAFPLVAAGLGRLTTYVGMSTEERSTFLNTAPAEELAALFLEAGDAHRLMFDSLFPEVDKVVRDRWIAHGSDEFARAVRAHARESREMKTTVNILAAQTRALLTPAEWKKNLAEREAHAESCERGALLREEQAAEAATSYKAMLLKLKERLKDGIIVPPDDEAK